MAHPGPPFEIPLFPRHDPAGGPRRRPRASAAGDSPDAPLHLRRYRVADAEPLSAAIEENLDFIRPWMQWAAGEPVSLPARHDLIRGWRVHWDIGNEYVYGIFQGAALIGSCGLHAQVGPGGLEIGYWVARSHTRRGIATAAAEALTTAAFALPGIERAEIHHDAANQASSGVPRALRYRLVGEVAEPVDAPEQTGVTVVWRTTSAQWAQR